MGEPAEDYFLRLPPEILEEILLRLPPDEPACLVRASAVRKAWRHILASAVFRNRYRDFHGTPVLGFVQECAKFFPISGLPTLPDASQWSSTALKALDCRHGLYIFDSFDQYSAGDTIQLTVLDPLTGHGSNFPTPLNNRVLWYSAAVLCAAQACDHHACQGEDFHVVFVTTNHEERATLGWLYSSQTNTWTELATLHHPGIIKYTYVRGCPSILVGDALYFDLDRIIQYQLGTLDMSMIERPADAKGRLMTAEDGGLGFATMVDVPNLTLWSMQTQLDRAVGWVKVRIINLTLPLPVLPMTTADDGISGIAEGRQTIFVSTRLGTYALDLKSKQARIVSGRTRKVFPYMRFYIPVMEAACLDQGQ